MTTLDPSVIVPSSGALRLFNIYATNPDATINLPSDATTDSTGAAQHFIEGSSKALLSVGGCILNLIQCCIVTTSEKSIVDYTSLSVESENTAIVQERLDALGLNTDLPDGSIVDMTLTSGYDDWRYNQIQVRCSVSDGVFTATSILESGTLYGYRYGTHQSYTYIMDANLVKLGEES